MNESKSYNLKNRGDVVNKSMLRIIKKFFFIKYNEVFPFKRSRCADQRALDFYEALLKFIKWKFIKVNKKSSASVQNIMRYCLES